MNLNCVLTQKLLEEYILQNGEYKKIMTVKFDEIGVSIRDGYLRITLYDNGTFLTEICSPDKYIDGSEHKISLFDSNLRLLLNNGPPF